jgi:hypothetical protein
MAEVDKAIEALYEFQRCFRPMGKIQPSEFYRNRIQEIISLLESYKLRTNNAITN